MSFKQKSLQRSVENTSGVDDWAPEKEGEMSSSFELLYKYFDTKNRATKRNKRKFVTTVAVVLSPRFWSMYYCRT